MKNFKKGFTLIELLVVIAIIGVLSAIVLASLNSARSKGDDAAAVSTANNMRTQAELYYHNNASSYGVTTTSCDAGIFNASTPGGLETLMESLKTKAGSTNVSCVASTSAWAVGINLKGPGTYCVDGKGAGKASTTAASAAASYNASTGTCL